MKGVERLDCIICGHNKINKEQDYYHSLPKWGKKQLHYHVNCDDVTGSCLKRKQAHFTGDLWPRT